MICPKCFVSYNEGQVHEHDDTPATLVALGFPDPDAIGASEYRAIYEMLEDALDPTGEEVADTPRDFAVAVLREFVSYATAELRRLGQPPTVYSVIEVCEDHGGHAHVFETLAGAHGFIAETREGWITEEDADPAEFDTDEPGALVWGERSYEVETSDGQPFAIEVLR